MADPLVNPDGIEIVEDTNEKAHFLYLAFTDVAPGNTVVFDPTIGVAEAQEPSDNGTSLSKTNFLALLFVVGVTLFVRQ